MDGSGSFSSGSLRTKISLKGGYSQLSLVCPFYGMKQELPPPSQLLGSDDLISYFDLSGSYNKYCGQKKLRDDLASFLPQICGTSNLNSNSRNDTSCSLRQLVEKPPITGKEVIGLSSSQMVGFKLAPGPVPENYRFFDLNDRPSEDVMFSPQQVYSSSSMGNEYQEFGKNFNDPEEVKDWNRKKYKRSLDDLEDNEKKVKKHRSEDKSDKEKDKKQKKKKKEKKKKRNLEEEPNSKRKEKREAAPFF